MPRLTSKFEGLIPSGTWDCFVRITFMAINSGDARYHLREIMAKTKEQLPNIVFLKHGQEDWTNNLFRDFSDDYKKPYATKMEVRIFARSILRAKQELAKMLTVWSSFSKEHSIDSIYQYKSNWENRSGGKK